MNADSFFAIGKTHKICQDYARVGEDSDGVPYAILSDGCSSSPDTDFGARILTQIADGGLREGLSVWDDEGKEKAREIVKQLGLPYESLDATLLTARYVPLFNSFNVTVRGDGVVAARRRDGSGFELNVFEYPSGAPEYPSYQLDLERRYKYLEEYGPYLTHRITKADGAQEEYTQDYWPSFLVSPEHYDLLLLMSDGAQSFQRMVNTGTSLTPERVPVREVVEQVLAVKGTHGEFITRRCTRFLKRFCLKNEWTHADDFSVAAIWMEDS